MAPEVVHAANVRNGHKYTGKVDIWSLGCVVLEMWAGLRPWPNINWIAVLLEASIHDSYTENCFNTTLIYAYIAKNEEKAAACPNRRNTSTCRS